MNCKYTRFLSKIFILCLILTVPLKCFAITEIKDGSELSIDDCIEIALQNDPNVKVAQNMYKISNSQVGQAKSDYFPSLTAGGTYNYQASHNSRAGMMNNMGYMNRGSSTNLDFSQINVSVNQLIWGFGKSIAKINMQKYNRESRGYDLENTKLDTIYNVKTAYYGLLAAKANQDIYRRSVRINQLNYDRTAALYKEGLKSKIDVVNAEVYLTDAKIQLLDADNKYQTAVIQLNNAMYFPNAPKYEIKNTESFNFKRSYNAKNEINIKYVKKGNIKDNDVEQSAVLTSGIEKQDILENFVFQPLHLTMEESIKRAYENRPDLKSLKMVMRAQEESLKAIKRSFLPDLTANAGYNHRRSDETKNSSFSVSAGLSFPMINIMDIKCKVDEGKSYLDIAKNNIDLSEKNIYFEVQNYYINMIQLEKRIPLMGSKVKQTLENFELADGRYTVGLGNFIELQDAQTNYNNAQLTYVQSVFDYNVARAQLERAMAEQ